MSLTTNKKWIFSIVLAGIFLVIPVQGVYTMPIKLFMTTTVFFLALAAFEIVPNLFIALLLPASWIALKVAPANVALSAYSSISTLMLPGALFLAATLTSCGLLSRIAYSILVKLKGNYFLLLLSIFLVGVVTNILTAGSGIMITAALAAGLCLSLDCMKTKLGAGIGMAVLIGGCQAHAYSYVSTNYAVLMGASGGMLTAADISPLRIMLHNWPLFFVSILTIFIISRWYKPESMETISNMDYFERKLKELGAISTAEKNNLIMTAILMVFLFTTDLHGIDMNLGFAIIPWMVYLPFMKGATFDTIKGIQFDMMFFVLSFMGIGTVGMSVGLGQVLADLCTAVLGGSTSIFLLMALLFAVVFGLNFVMTPMAIFGLLLVPVLTIAINMGHETLPFVYAINACSEAIIFPYEYAPYLLGYSFGMMKMADFIKLNAMRSVVFFAGFLFILVPYWMMTGLL